MKTKALVIFPESEATVDFIATFPDDIEVAILPDDAFQSMVDHQGAFPLGNLRKTMHIPVMNEPSTSAESSSSLDSELDEMVGDLEIIDGC